ncbi:MAG TPA: hypothetical protein PKC49_06445, partial [Phycisphaerae bacterium]|nr:hypothetical protein [Phycisphaerae bacterium]
NIWTMLLPVMCVNIGMWFERFVIIVTSLSADFLPSSWGGYYPSWVELLTLAGSFGLFMTLFLLFIRFLPSVAMAEIKTIMPQAEGHGPRGFDYNPDEYDSRGRVLATGGSH